MLNIVFGFTQSGIQPMIFHTRGRQAQREKCHTLSLVLPNQGSNQCHTQWSPTLEAGKLKGKNVIHCLVLPNQGSNQWSPTLEAGKLKGKNVIHSLWFHPIRNLTNDLPHSRQASPKGKMSYIVFGFTQSGIQPMISHTRDRQANYYTMEAVTNICSVVSI